MKDHRILSAQCGVSENGFGCGPVGGFVIAEARVQAEGEEPFYISLAEVGGIPNWFITDRSTYQMQLELSGSEEEVTYLQDHAVLAGMEYEDLFESGEEDELYALYRYMIYLVRCEPGEDEAMIAASEGKLLSELDIPMSDLEEEYREEMEEDEE